MSARRKKSNSSSRNDLFPDEDADIRKEVATLIDDPSKWLDMPNTQLAGTKPKDLIGTEREQMLRDLLRSIKYGIPR
jgi:uncharacterized protein (DUF2384 family)